MARRLIGLDIGTNAVTIAEVTPGTPPRLDMFAQVALPREAMNEGEIADEAAVSDAIARLRGEVGLKKVPVRVGIASPRVIVRQVEMPLMTRDELASALEFQAGDLIPIPIEEAVLDFAILDGAGESRGENGEPTMQVLLAAAQEVTVMRLVAAVEAGGLQVAAVDLVPLALTRALTNPLATYAPVAAGGIAMEDEFELGAEGLVSFGGGVTSIAVHEGGIPRFVRVIGSGGRELTDAIATDLNLPAESAEALKRQIGMPSDDELVARARTSVDRPLSVLLDEVRSSIDYYRNQPGAARLTRVVTTGGSSQLPGLPERLSALVGVPVEPADLSELIRIGDIGFPPEELPRLEPYLPAAVGLALGGAGIGTVVNLQPKGKRGSIKVAPRINPKIVAPVVVAVVALGFLTYTARGKAASAKKEQAASEAHVKKLQSQIVRQQATAGPSGGSSLETEAANLLMTDVQWADVVKELGVAQPAGVWMTTFQAQQTIEVAPPPEAPAAKASKGAAESSASEGGKEASEKSKAKAEEREAAAAEQQAAIAAAAPSIPANGDCSNLQFPLNGQLTMTGIAKDLPTLATYIEALAKDKDIADAWVSSTQKSVFGSDDVYTFSATATLAPGARSGRLEQFFKGTLCK